KSFIAIEEDIIVKPSTELIPDEYEHSTNQSVLFHVFAAPLVTPLAEELLKSVRLINYDVDTKRNLHDLNKPNEFWTHLEAIRKEAPNKSALILFFIGYYGKENGTLLISEEDFSKNVHVKQVWNFFSGNNCPELKHKPKIFVFCMSSQPRGGAVQTDSMRHRTMKFDKVYDFPAESDMLIVYKKVAEVDLVDIFLDELCNNIVYHSKKYDFIDLISYIHNNRRSVPLVISTLTRKFYLTPNDQRDHYLSVVENQMSLEEMLQKIHDDVQKLQDAQKKKKEKKFSFSFKKKSEDKPKVVKREDKPIVESPRTSVKTDGPSSPKASMAGPSPVHRLSGGSNSGRRSRNPSLSEVTFQKRKPIWKI
ncbi:uncharacterized protein LOC135127929, partial [Zophobas morio]|uniref:uncharacterized protein LOC135127929 n=1 Tax=Zophobas morio TaxID=2755281 RepID=UPI00308353C1